jgi:hypothetical protein
MIRLTETTAAMATNSRTGRMASMSEVGGDVERVGQDRTKNVQNSGVNRLRENRHKVGSKKSGAGHRHSSG